MWEFSSSYIGKNRQVKAPNLDTFEAVVHFLNGLEGNMDSFRFKTNEYFNPENFTKKGIVMLKDPKNIWLEKYFTKTKIAVNLTLFMTNELQNKIWCLICDSFFVMCLTKEASYLCKYAFSIPDCGDNIPLNIFLIFNLRIVLHFQFG